MYSCKSISTGFFFFICESKSERSNLIEPASRPQSTTVDKVRSTFLPLIWAHIQLFCWQKSPRTCILSAKAKEIMLRFHWFLTRTVRCICLKQCSVLYDHCHLILFGYAELRKECTDNGTRKCGVNHDVSSMEVCSQLSTQSELRFSCALHVNLIKLLDCIYFCCFCLRVALPPCLHCNLTDQLPACMLSSLTAIKPNIDVIASLTTNQLQAQL